MKGGSIGASVAWCVTRVQGKYEFCNVVVDLASFDRMGPRTEVSTAQEIGTESSVRRGAKLQNHGN